MSAAPQPIPKPVTVNRVIDGDTVVIDQVLWKEHLPGPVMTQVLHQQGPMILSLSRDLLGVIRLTLTDAVRMFGYNADETHDKDAAKKAKGIAAQRFLEALLPTGLPVLMSSKRDEKYGRELGTVFLLDGRNVNSVMLAQPGLVAPWDGTGPRPTV